MLVSKIKAIRNGRVIVKDFKTKDRNLVDINQERRRLEDKYEQALRDGDKGLAKIYSNRLEELRKEAIEAENKRDEERKNFGDSKTKDGEAEEAVIKAKLRANGDNAEAVKALMALGYSQADAFRTVKIWLENRDTVDPTKPKNIAAAKSLSVAQGKAASDAKTKDVGVKYVGTYKGIKIDKTNEGRFLAYINYDPVLKNSLQEMKDYIDKKATGDKRHLVRTDGGPGSGIKGHKSAHHIPDPSTHKERRKERTNLQKYIENARRSGNIKEAQKHSQRLAHINSLQLKG